MRGRGDIFADYIHFLFLPPIFPQFKENWRFVRVVFPNRGSDREDTHRNLSQGEK